MNRNSLAKKIFYDYNIKLNNWSYEIDLFESVNMVTNFRQSPRVINYFFILFQN